MKKLQAFLILGGAVVFAAIFFGANIIPPKQDTHIPSSPGAMSTPTVLSTEAVIDSAKKDLSAGQIQALATLENSVVRGDVNHQQIAVYGRLSDLWQKEYQRPDIAAYYLGKKAELEKSEKNLNFAAQNLLTDVMLSNGEPSKLSWNASVAKEFFEKALAINPEDDSARIGLGACYMFGNISNNPMEGILPVREIAEKNPKNVYAQMVLGLGGVRSGQFENAVKRFQNVLSIQPENMEASLNLAETYQRLGDKANAIKYYKKVLEKIKIPEAQQELKERIGQLQQ